MSTAIDILSEIEASGGTAKLAGDNIQLSAPEPLPDALMSKARRHKPELLDALKRLHGLTLHELRELAGEDWAFLSRTAEALEGYAMFIMDQRAWKAGRVPLSWTYTAVCPKCGPIFINENLAMAVLSNPPKVSLLKNCPWCPRREQGLTYPKAKTANLQFWEG